MTESIIVEGTPTPAKRRKWPLYVGGGAAVFLLGVGAGSSGGSDSTPSAEPSPAETVTVTETVEAVPDLCLLALEDADDLIDIFTQTADLNADHLNNDSALFTALADGDYSYLDTYSAGLDEYTSTIGELTSQVNANTYAANRDLCRAAATS